jgi:hypothetical protein
VESYFQNIVNGFALYVALWLAYWPTRIIIVFVAGFFRDAGRVPRVVRSFD